MREISADGMRALFAQETDEVFVFAVRLSHPDWLEDALMVADEVDMIVGVDTYVAFPFTTSLPPQQEGSLPSVQLSIDNIERQYVERIRNTLIPPKAEVSVYRRSFDGSNTKESDTLKLTVVSCAYNVTALTLTLALNADYLNEPATKDRFVPSNTPGIFA